MLNPRCLARVYADAPLREGGGAKRRGENATQDAPPKSRKREIRAYDERRTAFLATQGVEVLRLQNRTIDEFFHLAMAKIAERAAERIREREEPRRRSAASEGRVLPPPLRGTPLPEGGISVVSR